MDKDEIISMAREAGVDEWEIGIKGNRSESQSRHLAKYERFAALVAAHEREACAKVCDELKATYELDGLNGTKSYHEAAAAIRARGDK